MIAKAILVLLLFSNAAFASWGKAYIQNETGIYYLNRKIGDNAIEKFTQALNQHPQSGQIKFNIGNAYYQNQEWDNALMAYQESATLLPKEERLDAIFNSADIWIQKGEIEKAILAYKHVLKHQSNHKNAKINLELTQKLKQTQSQNKQISKQDDNEDTHTENNEQEAKILPRNRAQILNQIKEAEQKSRQKHQSNKRSPKEWVNQDW